MLPRSTKDSGIIIVAEHQENLDITREFRINKDCVYKAPKGLIDKNPPYRGMTIDLNDGIINDDDLVQDAETQEDAVEAQGERERIIK
ncbi:hypothetical protein NPIL_358841 [Nephila pilipes]|uniref:Uncharacterized protein n=1 Tax=Nephila pilipes TaxID=299642 RepID=A0A8X6TYD7_NEPPI|nr:hypothetical protein NPIL_358841 [Nephila pilipes]